MTTTPPIHDWHHEKGYEIPTKHKEAIRELAAFGNKSVKQLADRYELGQSSIRRVLNYSINFTVEERYLSTLGEQLGMATRAHSFLLTDQASIEHLNKSITSRMSFNLIFRVF
jgi:hypothetical protein